MRQVELLHFRDCPNWPTADKLLGDLSGEVDFELTRRLVETSAEAEAIGFRGSPSILVDGVDVFAEGDEPVGLSCRIYRTPDGPAGSPTLEQLRAVLTGGGDESRGANNG